mmetsp:Transcript_33322/g.80601  ORF Transcript_33322/g.80601 Transcript_33322/m.80601 type:complete len:533 (+) Transcript_33322:101-1699(+)
MPSRSRTYHDCKQFCRSSSICGSFFAMIWCINMLISAVTSLGYVSKYFDEWIEAEALIIGRNVTVHYRNSNNNGSQSRRLINSNIPNFTAADNSLLGNQTDLFDNTTTDDSLSNIDVMDDLGNTTEAENNSTQVNGNNNNKTNNNNGEGDSNEDWSNGDINRATSAPTIPPVEPEFGGRLVYCAEVQFKIVDSNITITAVSDTYCSYEFEDIIVGHTFGILYNPAVPQEIIEESLYAHAQNTLRLTVGVTVFFTLGYLLCSIYLWRSQPDMARAIFPHGGHDLDLQDANPNEIAQTREEREALMKTKFLFQTVLEDLSNTDAANIRRLCLKGAEEGSEPKQCAGQVGCGCNNKETEGKGGAETQLQDDIEAQQQQQKNDPMQRNNDKEGDLELDLTKSDIRDENSTSNTAETETDTDAGSNNQGSEPIETNNDTKQPQQQQQQQSQEQQESAWSLAGATNLISSWTNAALAPSSAPECCICLETYQPGDKICTARRDGCDHVFHQQCIEAWLYRHDACPLCRVDLMNNNSEE